MSSSIRKVISLSEAPSEPIDAWGDDPAAELLTTPAPEPAPTAIAQSDANDAWPLTRIAYCCSTCWEDESKCTCSTNLIPWGLQ